MVVERAQHEAVRVEAVDAERAGAKQITGRRPRDHREPRVGQLPRQIRMRPVGFDEHGVSARSDSPRPCLRAKHRRRLGRLQHRAVVKPDSRPQPEAPTDVSIVVVPRHREHRAQAGAVGGHERFKDQRQHSRGERPLGRIRWFDGRSHRCRSQHGDKRGRSRGVLSEPARVRSFRDDARPFCRNRRGSAPIARLPDSRCGLETLHTVRRSRHAQSWWRRPRRARTTMP